MNIQELIDWNNKLTRLLNEKERGEGTLSWSMMVEEHLKEFIDKWNDHPVVLKLMKAYIESEAERIYWSEGYGKGVCTWFNVGGLRKDPFFDKARKKLEKIIKESDPDKQMVINTTLFENLKTSYIKAEEQRLAFCQNYRCDPEDPWLVLDDDPINIKVREKLKVILGGKHEF